MLLMLGLSAIAYEGMIISVVGYALYIINKTIQRSVLTEIKIFYMSLHLFMLFSQCLLIALSISLLFIQ